jgi:hypothetical protein
MSDDSQHRALLAKAYQEASRRLRKKHDAEFHGLLAEVYWEWDIKVKKRRSRTQVKVDAVEAAKKLIAESDV